MPAPTAAAAGAENGAPRTELQELQFKAGQVTDEVNDIWMQGCFRKKCSIVFLLIEYWKKKQLKQYSLQNIFLAFNKIKIK